MLKERLYIDGEDVYTKYGVYVVKGGWNELIAYPPLKSVTYNDWQEQDGVEADLSNPVLNTHDVQIKFAYDGDKGAFFTLIELLSDGAYHTFDCASIGRSYVLRLVSSPNLKELLYLGSVTLKFADDFPLRNYTYQAPKSDIATVTDYLIDDVPFTNYGARVLKGTLDEIKKPSTVKTNLLRNISSQSGVSYDGANVFYKSKDVKVGILMRASTLAELWQNYDALLYDLIRSGERRLFVFSLWQEFPCYYKSCQVNSFYPTGKIWLQFTLTLTFTREFRISDRAVLITEDYIPIITEREENYIEMNKLEVK